MNPLSSRVKDLRKVATELNATRDQMNLLVKEFNDQMKKLSLGISGWVSLAGGCEGGVRWERAIGYAKINNHWCLALREAKYIDNNRLSEERWPFTDGPSYMRAVSVGKIPELLDHLAVEAIKMVALLKEKTEELRTIIEAIKEVASVEGL